MTQNQIAYQQNKLREQENIIKAYEADTKALDVSNRKDLIDAQISQIILEYGDIVPKDYKHDPKGVSGAAKRLNKLSSVNPTPIKTGDAVYGGQYTDPYRQQEIEVAKERNRYSLLGQLFGTVVGAATKAIPSGKK